MKQFPASKHASSSTKFWKPTLSTAYLTTPIYSSGRKIGPLYWTMGRINTQQTGPLYRSRRFQDTIQINSPSFLISSKSESVFLPVFMRRDFATSPETGSGKGTSFRNSRFLLPAISCPEKEQKVTSSNRSFPAKSIHKETTIQDGDSQVSMTIDIGQSLDCLHRPDRCLPTCSDSPLIQEVSLVHVRRSGLPIHGPTFWNVPKAVDFHQTNCSALACHLVISVSRWLADKTSNLQLTSISHTILPSNCTKSRIHSKSKEVRFDTSPEIHIYKIGISDTTKYSQDISGPSRFSSSKYQSISFSDSNFGTNFPFSFGQT